MGFKFPNLVIYTQIMPRRILVETQCTYVHTYVLCKLLRAHVIYILIKDTRACVYIHMRIHYICTSLTSPSFTKKKNIPINHKKSIIKQQHISTCGSYELKFHKDLVSRRWPYNSTCSGDCLICVRLCTSFSRLL